MPPPTNRLDGYCTTSEQESLVSGFFMVPDVNGNTTLRICNFSPIESWSKTMPLAVVAADLTQSIEARERAIGLELLDVLITANRNQITGL
jgi:hypothetical protein